MKHLIFGLIFILAASANAHTEAEIEKMVTIAIIKQADSLALVNQDGSPVPEAIQLPSLLATALLENYYHTTPDTTRLSDFKVLCPTDSATHVDGGTSYSCNLMFGHGNFKVKKDTYVNLDGNDEALFEMEVLVPDDSNYEIKIIDNTLKMYRQLIVDTP